MQSYSQDLRERVSWGLERGERPTAIARRLEVSRVWVYRVRERWQKAGERSSFRIGGHRRSRVPEKESLLRVWIEEEPGLSLAELCERLAGQGVSIKIGALWHQLNKWRLTFKKNAARQRARARGRAAGTEKAGGRGCPRWKWKSSCSSMKPGRRRAGRPATDGHPAVSVAATRRRTGIGKQPPLWVLSAAGD